MTASADAGDPAVAATPLLQLLVATGSLSPGVGLLLSAGALGAVPLPSRT